MRVLGQSMCVALSIGIANLPLTIGRSAFAAVQGAPYVLAASQVAVDRAVRADQPPTDPGCDMMRSGTATSLRYVWGSNPADVYACGANVVVHYDGAHWQRV